MNTVAGCQPLHTPEMVQNGLACFFCIFSTQEQATVVTKLHEPVDAPSTERDTLQHRVLGDGCTRMIKKRTVQPKEINQTGYKP